MSNKRKKQDAGKINDRVKGPLEGRRFRNPSGGFPWKQHRSGKRKKRGRLKKRFAKPEGRTLAKDLEVRITLRKRPGRPKGGMNQLEKGVQDRGHVGKKTCVG